MKFTISTYNASELIADAHEKQDLYGNYSLFYSVDYTYRRMRRRFLKATSKYSDTAVFYQIRKVLEEENVPFNNDMDKYLIFMDFDRLFDIISTNTEDSEKIEKKLKDLFKNGVDIHYEDRDVHYMPYEKSNSMARESKMSFINSAIKDKLDRRLTLDIDFSEIDLQLSKYYAYKGLYMSTAVRVDSEELILNSDRVVIIDDDECLCKNKEVITADSDDTKTKWTIKETVKDLELKVFDGEGIISPVYSDIINSVNINGKNVFDGASSYQIRMPFVKGMLHRVDFKKFIREYTGSEDTFIVKDAFGIERNIMNADIIMPVSMFKCKNWIKQDRSYDIMSLKKYDHALYISNTDIIYGNTSETTLNYQILNTLSLTDSEMDELIENHLKRVRNQMEYEGDLKVEGI